MNITFLNDNTGRATWTSTHTDGLEMDMQIELYAEFDWDGGTAAVYQVGVTDPAGECLNKMLQALYMNSRRGELEMHIEEAIPASMKSPEFRDDLQFGVEP